MRFRFFLPFLLGFLLGCTSGGNETAPAGPTAVAPAIQVQPVDQTVWSQSSATFSVQATGTDLRYQWMRNEAPISGANLPTCVVGPVGLGDHLAQFWVTVSNSAGTVKSSRATLRVNEAPSITQQPESLAIQEGEEALFRVEAYGTPTLRYQWRRDGQDIAGATATTYRIPSAQRSDDGVAFTVRVSNDFGDISSTPAMLRVSSPHAPPVITQQPTDLAMLVGQSGQILVRVEGSEPIRYQWFRDGVPVEGAVQNVLAFTNVQPTQAGQYAVRVQNPAGEVLSRAARVEVNSILPSIVNGPANAVVGTGRSATFRVEAAGSPPLAYQWLKNGAVIAGATGTEYTTPPTTMADDRAKFAVRVSNAGGSIVSQPAELRVFIARVITGEVRTVHLLNGQESVRPENLSTSQVEAVQGDGVSGFQHYPGTGDAEGRFRIEDVPPGPFTVWLRTPGRTPYGLYASAEALDLSRWRPGRADAVLATGAQATLAIMLQGPLAGTFQGLELGVPTLGLALSQAGTGPIYSFPWTGRPLLQAPQDGLWVLGMSEASDATTTTTRIGGAVLLPAFNQSDFGEVRKSATPVATPSDRKHTFAVDLDAYAAMQTATHPAATQRGTFFAALRVQPEGGELGPLGSWMPLLQVRSTGTGALHKVDTPYADPFPAEWMRLVQYRHAFSFELPVPGRSFRARISDAFEECWMAALAPAGERKPTIHPVENARVGTSSLHAPPASVGLVPTFTWTTRNGEVFSYFVVTIFTVSNDGSLQAVGEFQTEMPVLSVPPGVFTEGKPHVVRITTVHQGAYSSGQPYRPSWPSVSVPFYSSVLLP